MTEQTEIIEKIEEIMSNELGLSDEHMQDSTKVVDTSISSLEFMEMIFRVEEEFGVSIEVIEMPEVETIGEIKQYVADLLTEKPETQESNA